jgi:hypothetical protein
VSRVGRCDALDQTTSASSVKIAASHVSDRFRVDVKAELVMTAAVLHKPTVVPRPLSARILVRHSSAAPV